MDNLTCQNCKYFVQHYVLSEGRLTLVYCGHCTYGRVKRKTQDTSACENFIAGDTGVESFVSKEYLTKKLLDWVTSLELLPEIDGDCRAD